MSIYSRRARIMKYFKDVSALLVWGRKNGRNQSLHQHKPMKTSLLSVCLCRNSVEFLSEIFKYHSIFVWKQISFERRYFNVFATINKLGYLKNDYLNILFYLAQCYFEIILRQLFEQENDFFPNYFIIRLSSKIIFYFFLYFIFVCINNFSNTVWLCGVHFTLSWEYLLFYFNELNQINNLFHLNTDKITFLILFL